ncbi:transposase, partial [Enterococcus dongliensis]
MKNYWRVSTLLLVLLVFVGCSNDKEVSSGESPTNQSTSQPKIENISKDLTLYEIFNIGENSKFVSGGVAFYHLLNVGFESISWTYFSRDCYGMVILKLTEKISGFEKGNFSMKRKHYSKEFKFQAVSLILTDKHPVRFISKQLD